MVEVVVEHEYVGQEDDELTIRVGDIISGVIKSDGGWWEGFLKGRKGVFPDNFVKEIKKNNLQMGNISSQSTATDGNKNKKFIQSPVQNNSKRFPTKRVRATYSYEPQNDDELKLHVNDIIDVIAEEEEGWYKGIMNGKIGVFPSNFVEPVEQTLVEGEDDVKSNDKNKDDQENESISHGHKRNHPHQLKTIIQQKEMDEQKGKEKPLNKVSHMNDVAPPPPALPPKLRDNKSERARVAYSYVAENEDELSLNIGDVVNVLQKELEDVGWWKGEVNGKIGVFPDNYVKLIPQEMSPVANKPRLDPDPSPTHKKLERPPPPNPAKITTKLSKSEEEKKVKPLPPSGPPPIVTGKKTPDQQLIALTDDHKAKEKLNKEASSVVTLSLDSVSSSQKLSHPTANRVRAPPRRPPSSIVLHKEFFEQPEGKTERGQETKGGGGPPLPRPPPPTSLHKDEKKTQPTVSSPDTRKELFSPGVLSPKIAAVGPLVVGIKLPIPAMTSDLGDSVYNQLKKELGQLKEELCQLKANHGRRMDELEAELMNEKKIRLHLQDEVDQMKKIILQHSGKL